MSPFHQLLHIGCGVAGRVIQAHPLPSNANRLYISVVYVFKKGKHTPSGPGSNWTSLPSPSTSVVSEDGNENQALDEDDINGNREQKRCAAESR